MKLAIIKPEDLQRIDVNLIALYDRIIAPSRFNALKGVSNKGKILEIHYFFDVEEIPEEIMINLRSSPLVVLRVSEIRNK